MEEPRQCQVLKLWNVELWLGSFLKFQPRLLSGTRRSRGLIPIAMSRTCLCKVYFAVRPACRVQRDTLGLHNMLGDVRAISCLFHWMPVHFQILAMVTGHLQSLVKKKPLVHWSWSRIRRLILIFLLFMSWVTELEFDANNTDYKEQAEICTQLYVLNPEAAEGPYEEGWWHHLITEHRNSPAKRRQLGNIPPRQYREPNINFRLPSFIRYLVFVLL